MADAESDSPAVLVTDNQKVADTVVEWLKSEGIEAEVHYSPTQVSSDPLTGMTEGAPVEELEVRVVDIKRLDDAKKLLSDAQRTARLHSIRELRSQRTGTVTAVCEDCGKSSAWPATAMGTTDVCPFCQHFMDIPDPDDDWSDVDFGTAEEEEEKG
jgi:hypothetical protein